MTSTSPDRDLTAALAAYSEGNAQAGEDVLKLVYARLHDMAEEQRRREGPGHTLQPTAPVNEAYLRLADQRGPCGTVALLSDRGSGDEIQDQEHEPRKLPSYVRILR